VPQIIIIIEEDAAYGETSAVLSLRRSFNAGIQFRRSVKTEISTIEELLVQIRRIKMELEDNTAMEMLYLDNPKDMDAIKLEIRWKKMKKTKKKLKAKDW